MKHPSPFRSLAALAACAVLPVLLGSGCRTVERTLNVGRLGTEPARASVRIYVDLDPNEAARKPRPEPRQDPLYRAVAALENAAPPETEGAETFCSLGDRLVREGRWRNARLAYDSALRLVPEHPRAIAGLAMLADAMRSGSGLAGR